MYVDVGVVVDVMFFIDDMVVVYGEVDFVICCVGVFIFVEFIVVGFGVVLVLFLYVVDDY